MVSQGEKSPMLVAWAQVGRLPPLCVSSLRIQMHCAHFSAFDAGFGVQLLCSWQLLCCQRKLCMHGPGLHSFFFHVTRSVRKRKMPALQRLSHRHACITACCTLACINCPPRICSHVFWTRMLPR